MAEVNPYLEDILKGLNDFDLGALRNKQILVTGATRMIGG